VKVLKLLICGIKLLVKFGLNSSIGYVAM
jgi:hypothetical protein